MFSIFTFTWFLDILEMDKMYGGKSIRNGGLRLMICL